MNKEEILKRARTENAGVDEVKRDAEAAAAQISHAVGLAMCMLLNLLDSLFLQTDVIGEAAGSSTAAWSPPTCGPRAFV